jgi:HSP20 family protein
MRERASDGGQEGRNETGVEQWRSRGFRELGGARSPIAQLFDDFFGPALGSGMGMMGSGQAVWPVVDVDEDDESYTVCMEVPGVSRDDLQIEMQQDQVIVRGEKRRGDRGGRARWNERRYGSFVRAFSLPSDADPDQARAKFEDGVLVLTFPKREESKPRRIEIESGSGGQQQRQ